ncbi:hypothetical protein CDL12_18734 [Handroanthus impetiginosus]|uniref:Uncharacterized protein n=1 Tax=Handroanthus impetiginosus TaxID=429701 RepID=A0A2G9GTS6_9LAMI|nr:hypothetical protein CDL12_18734 [Handroanthus impetiginosus]
MEPVVASLWSSFRRVPPAAIPAMLDCILASTTASPSSLFSELLNEFHKLTKAIVEKSEMMESELRNCVMAYVAALTYFLKKSGAHHMHMFVWKLLIPLLKLVHTCDRELFNEVTRLFLDAVIETNSWEVLEATMVPLLLRSIGLSMGMFQSEEVAIYGWSENSTFNDSIDKEVSPKSFDDFQDKLTEQYMSKDLLVSHSYEFPLSLSCNILTLTLDAALQNKHGGVVPGSNLASESQAKLFAGNLLWDLSNLSLKMLLESLEHRSLAIRFLLPCIFKAFAHDCTFKHAVPGMPHVLTRKDFFIKIWKSCKILFSLGFLERRDAYDVLSLYLSFPSQTDEHREVNVGGSEETFDLRDDEEFWNEIKRGLLDKESLMRKQSLHILKTTLNLSKERKCYSDILEEVSDDRGSSSRMTSKRGRWADEEAKSLGVGRICNHNESSFPGLYRWEAFVLLYEMLEEYGTHLVEAAWNHQIMLWLRSSFPLENSGHSFNEDLYHNRMATAEQIFEWLAILWERGFCHDNPQVRCLIMQSFLSIEWENYGSCAKLVPKDFILGPLIRVKEIYSSWTIEAAARFLCQYTSYMEQRQHISFLVDLSSISKVHSFGRPGLMCLVECIASAACGIRKHNNHEIEQLIDATSDEVIAESAPTSCQNDRVNLLDVLRFVLECSKQHFNPKYRHQVYEKILAAASSVTVASDIPLEILLHFISSLPREYTDYGGSLRDVVQKWLRGANRLLLKAIDGFPRNFISYQHPLDSLFTYDDEELESWGSEAKRWARVLFLVVEGGEHIAPILKFIQDHGGEICEKNFLEWAAVKFLILVSSLVEELLVIQARTAKYRMAGRVKRDLDFPVIVDDLSFTEEPIIFYKFAVVLFSFLEELVSFAKLSCSVFGSAEVRVDMILPGSIRGKLGGPSQRRLPSSLCTSGLEAITAVKTIASVLRGCAQFRTDVLKNSAQAFLWNFCWKIITTPTPKSEVEAEICIAAYEACAYALKDLLYVFSPLSLDLVRSNDKSCSLEGDAKALLDMFVSTFIHNINNIIDGGNLARTRRAILMNWKWSCLESLLSLPNYALRNGVQSGRHNFYFSDTTITQIFSDLVGSLENAGEVSTLPMLRSVRLCMSLFDSKRMDPAISSPGVIILQMMWRLVHSSWILHISCNKRRVAPIAALLSSVLHYSVFGDDQMHEFNNASGPLKWFVEKILEEGTKSPRTIRLAALHLCGLWMAYPNTLRYYVEELKLLTFYGSVAFDEDFEAELTENYDARTEVSLLSRSLDPELTDVFINTELYARVSVAVLFSKLADMAYLVKSPARNEDKLAAIASGKMFLLELLNSVVFFFFPFCFKFFIFLSLPQLVLASRYPFPPTPPIRNFKIEREQQLEISSNDKLSHTPPEQQIQVVAPCKLPLGDRHEGMHS